MLRIDSCALWSGSYCLSLPLSLPKCARGSHSQNIQKINRHSCSRAPQQFTIVGMKSDQGTRRARKFKLPPVRRVCQPAQRHGEDARHFMLSYTENSRPSNHSNYWSHAEVSNGNKIG